MTMAKAHQKKQLRKKTQQWVLFFSTICWIKTSLVRARFYSWVLVAYDSLEDLIEHGKKTGKLEKHFLSSLSVLLCVSERLDLLPMWVKGEEPGVTHLLVLLTQGSNSQRLDLNFRCEVGLYRLRS